MTLPGAVTRYLKHHSRTDALPPGAISEVDPRDKLP